MSGRELHAENESTLKHNGLGMNFDVLEETFNHS